jgi:hypothetical protein
VATTTFVTVVATPAMVVTATEVENPASGMVAETPLLPDTVAPGGGGGAPGRVAEAPLLPETVAPGGGRGAPGRVAEAPLFPEAMTPGVGATMVTIEVTVIGDIGAPLATGVVTEIAVETTPLTAILEITAEETLEASATGQIVVKISIVLVITAPTFVVRAGQSRTEAGQEVTVNISVATTVKVV